MMAHSEIPIFVTNQDHDAQSRLNKVTDALDNTVQMTQNPFDQIQKLITKSGQVVWQGIYESFGTVTEIINTIDNPLRFPGQYADGETGTYYNYFRNYDPVLGSYLEIDPLGLSGGLNSFSYAKLNPLNLVDEFGLKADINLHHDRSDHAKGNAIPDDPAAIIVAAHGTRLAIYRGDTAIYLARPISAQATVDMILALEKAKTVRRVRLVACSTGAGKNSFAQEVANLLSSEWVVEAADIDVFVDQYGRIAVAPPKDPDARKKTPDYDRVTDFKEYFAEPK